MYGTAPRYNGMYQIRTRARLPAVTACLVVIIAPRAGTWRGLEVAIKRVIFESDCSEAPSAAANECRIASELVHPNVVATYSHLVRPVRDADGEHDLGGLFKMYLVQVRTRFLTILVILRSIICIGSVFESDQGHAYAAA